MAVRLPQTPAVKYPMISWARARLSGALFGVEVSLLDFDAKAKA
jgi:hypothetical protein